jgi:hypothetical protein
MRVGRMYVFADEAGNFDFKAGGGASRYFIIGTVSARNPDVGNRLLELRRELAWQGIALESTFHATQDLQLVRDQVFQLLQNETFRFDVTILDKRKTIPKLQADQERFYKQAWYLHFKYVCPQIVRPRDQLMVVAASIGTKKRRRIIRLAIEDVVAQVAPCRRWEVAFWPSESDPCLQVADYCTWAVQRLYEAGDARSYALIQAKIASEFQPFADSQVTYY